MMNRSVFKFLLIYSFLQPAPGMVCVCYGKARSRQAGKPYIKHQQIFTMHSNTSRDLTKRVSPFVHMNKNLNIKFKVWVSVPKFKRAVPKMNVV